MTDLRDRIAAAVADELTRQATRRNEYSFKYTPLDDEGNDLQELIGLDTSIDPAVVADAVIEALASPIRGCTDQWHWSTGAPFRCPSCGYWMGEGYVE
jgi:hypothetical protein